MISPARTVDVTQLLLMVVGQLITTGVIARRDLLEVFDRCCTPILPATASPWSTAA